MKCLCEGVIVVLTILYLAETWSIRIALIQEVNILEVKYFR